MLSLGKMSRNDNRSFDESAATQLSNYSDKDKDDERSDSTTYIPGTEPIATPGDKSDVIGEPANKVVSANDVSLVPDGGLRAWLQVLGGFFLFFNSWGIVNTFGVFQTYYETELLSTTSASSISWIGSLQAFLLMFIGAMTGPVYDAGYFRALIISGALLTSFGMMMVSLCHEFWQVLLAQGFVVGAGCGMLFVPSVAILSTYFSRHLALAMGLAASGSSLGGVIYPIMFHKLQPMIGFGWTTRVLGFMMFGTLLISIAVMKVRVLPQRKRKVLDLAAFKYAPYSIFIAGSFLSFVGLYTPFFYVQLYDISKNITAASLVFYLLPILNAASIFGRIIPNFFADKIGPFNVFIPCGFIAGLLCVCLIPINSTGSLVVFCLLYGFFSGTFVSLPPAVLVGLCKNRAMIGTHMGMAFACTSIGLLIGTPIAGAINDASGFNAIWIFGGVLTMGGSLILLLARLLKTNWAIVVRC
ncbi:putative monocarboxylate permease [Pseudovirgaria hyperparasitica]|uniref:Putative monocarboxylate permease n=1 Tax=Pseudovirgaria hyperparasitica TaxID=470096 RepID=A0A6A6WFV0_9PEZI|nr:putative monocarboxylate permease [Pseudovirgaria hyperparasitica]KAF2761059.1 putative monocarboxylate permease [Pseudovirgaria hyperparasitica]